LYLESLAGELVGQSNNNKISIIVPTYNEKDNITPLVERLHKKLDSINYEILFVDDNSRDGTAETIHSLAGKYPVKVMVRKDKRGLSSAVVDGIKATVGDMVIVMDADLQHPPEIVPQVIKALKSHELAVGSRYAKGGSPGEEWKLSRKIVSAVANLLSFPLAPKIKDRMSGFFGFQRSAVNANKLNAVGWKIGLEIMAKGNFKSVTEVPYTFAVRERGASKLSRKIMWQYIKQLVMLYLNHYQISNFMIVGGIGYAINIGVYSLLLQAPVFKSTSFVLGGKNYYLFPFVISSFVAIISNYILNKIWTFREWTENKWGGLRYLSMALATLGLDMAFLWMLVDIGKLPPIGAAALAILIVFIVRYLIAKKWVWTKKDL
jgi:dolichol-phosphate mannosyltransferase